MVTEYDKLNDVESLDSEDFGGYFKQFRQGISAAVQKQRADEDRSVISNAFETFVCYGLDVERTPLFAVRYPRCRIGIREEVTVSVYTDKEIITYRPTTMAALKLVRGEERERHYWGEVPDHGVTPQDRYRQSGFEDVIPLIDLYDAAQSDTSNYMTDLNEATLVVSGDLDLSKYTVKEVVEMKKANLLLLANGVNPDGSKSQTDAKYIYKQYDVSGTEAYKERLQGDIHKISFVPDLTDESFSGNQIRRSYEI